MISLVRLNHISILDDKPKESSREDMVSTKKPKFDALAKMGPAVLVDQFVENILKKHGLGGVIGFCGTVAEGGFVLGGGIGMQSRLYGLGLDNVAVFPSGKRSRTTLSRCRGVFASGTSSASLRRRFLDWIGAFMVEETPSTVFECAIVASFECFVSSCRF